MVFEKFLALTGAKLARFTFKHKDILLRALIILFPFSLYLKTLLPGLGNTGDTAKWQFMGKILGIPHATGYPLYILLNKLFIQIPLRSVAYRVNLMSAVFSVLTLFFLYNLLKAISKSRTASFFSTLLFAFSMTYWSQSIVAEVYTLNSLFLSIVFLALIQWHKTRKEDYFYLFLFFYALSFGNHLTTIALLPAFLVFIMAVDLKIFIRPRAIAAALASIAVLAGLYSYFFIRTFQRAAYLEHEIRNFKGLIALITGKQFQSKMFGFSLQEILSERIPGFFGQFFDEWSIALFLLAAVGVFFLWKAEKKLFWLFIVSFLGQAIFLLNYDIPDISAFFIPLFLIFSIVLCFGIVYLLAKAQNIRILSIALQVALVFFLSRMIISNYPKVDKSKERDADLRLTAFFEHIPRYSVLITDNYLDKEYVYYKTLVEYPDKPVLHLEIASENNIVFELYINLSMEFRTNRGLREYLFPSDYLKFSSEKLLDLFFKDKNLQEKLFAHVYLISSSTKEAFEKQDFKIKPVIFKSKKGTRKYQFFRVSLEGVFT
jgi:hypothetical protein